jgi:plasmid stabilization system protein ParE
MAKPKPYRVDDQAWIEVEAADDWYQLQSEEASAAFLAEVYSAFETISQAPRRWPMYLHGTRRFLLHHFPFSIVYLDDPDGVTFVAVAHNKRKPGYWKERV